MNRPLLKVRDLRVTFTVGTTFFGKVTREVKAVDNVSFDLAPGETLGLVGESGSGKSTTARAILGLTKPTSGSIELDGKEIVTMSTAEMREMYRDLQVVFQDPMSSLNPRMTAAQNVAEPLVNFGFGSKEKIDARVAELFAQVGLRPDQLGRYPHEFSGGQRQRLGIARAMAIRPKLIICDEPVSALDVSVQAQVINLLGDLQRSTGISLLFVAHDLAVVEHISDRVAVMFLGAIVEIGRTSDIFGDPQHPYTRKLLGSVLHFDPTKNPEGFDLPTATGGAGRSPTGCRYAHLCPVAEARCHATPPELRAIGPDRQVACHLVA
jgi:peptide/nickel transport system ATP-binding protein